MFVFAQPHYHAQDVTQGQFLSKVNLVLNSEFSSSLTCCQTKVKKISLSYYCGGRTDGFILFPGALNMKWNVNSHIQVLNSGG